MCGIAGICGGLIASSVRSAEAMSDYLAHRGPDDAGSWVSPSGAAVLTHRRLAIIDLSDAGHQPMSTSDGRFTVACNGEIYNFAELREELALAGTVFRSRSDTEVLLELWAKEGAECLTKIHGMFAFAVWDEVSRTLTLARDPFGIKPLYYRFAGNVFAFASELLALRRAGFATDLSWKGVRAFLQFGSIPAPLTLYQDVTALLPGTILQFNANDLSHSSRSYWDYAERLCDSQSQNMTWPDARRRVREALLTSAREHLAGDVPVGAFLSGGTDSTAVVSLMRQVDESPIKTFSIGFDVPSFDERSYARVAARRFGTEHREYLVTGADFDRERERILSSMDQPTVDGVNVYFVSKYAAEAGVKVVTSGLGGDEFFQGYPYFQKIPKLLHAGRAPLHWFVRAAARCLPSQDGNRTSRLVEFLAGDRRLRSAYLACRRIRATAETARLFDDRDPLIGTECDDLDLLFDDARIPVELGKRITLLEARSYMANTLLRDSDVFSMAHSLELRLPLVYDRLAECLSAIPQAFLGPNGYPKALLIAAVGDIPCEIVDRPKMCFTFPLEHWLRAAAPYEFLARSWDRSTVDAVQERFRSGRAPLAAFWSLIVLDRFLADMGH